MLLLIEKYLYLLCFLVVNMVKYMRKLISEDVDKQIHDMQIKIQQTFGMPVSYVKASKVVAWKSQQYNINLTAEKLMKIIGS